MNEFVLEPCPDNPPIDTAAANAADVILKAPALIEAALLEAETHLSLAEGALRNPHSTKPPHDLRAAVTTCHARVEALRADLPIFRARVPAALETLKRLHNDRAQPQRLWHDRMWHEVGRLYDEDVKAAEAKREERLAAIDKAWGAAP